MYSIFIVLFVFFSSDCKSSYIFGQKSFVLFMCCRYFLWFDLPFRFGKWCFEEWKALSFKNSLSGLFSFSSMVGNICIMSINLNYSQGKEYFLSMLSNKMLQISFYVQFCDSFQINVFCMYLGLSMQVPFLSISIYVPTLTENIILSPLKYINVSDKLSIYNVGPALVSN